MKLELPPFCPSDISIQNPLQVEGDQAKIVIRPLSPLARALEEADIQSEEDESAVELGTYCIFVCHPLPVTVANDGLGWDPPTENMIILVVTITRRGPHLLNTSWTTTPLNRCECRIYNLKIKVALESVAWQNGAL